MGVILSCKFNKTLLSIGIYLVKYPLILQKYIQYQKKIERNFGWKEILEKDKAYNQ